MLNTTSLMTRDNAPTSGDRNGFLQASSNGRAYRQCKNHKEYEVCNWMVPFENENELCSSCRLTQTIPDLDNPENKVLWYRI